MVDSPGRITLWGVEVFVATAEEGSISAAARRLDASPSTISQQLTNLESAIGTTLLHRNTRPVLLTPAGEVFRRRAGNILNEAALARAELAMGDMSNLTRFRLGMIEDFEADVTPRLLTRLAGDLKGCQFLLETGASHYLQDLLDARALDMIVAAEMGAEADWMELHPILTEGFVVAAPRGTVAPGGDVLAQLKALPLVQYTTRHHMGRLLTAHLARQNLTLSPRFELDSYHAILAMVGQGAGWTILTPLALMRARRFADQLDVLPLPFAPLSRTITLTARKGILQDMPARVADELKPLLKEVVIEPAVAAYPFMEDVLTMH
ncbi:LysR family transcriptional regulator [Lutimaribacter sp. EGI FJ00015]|uniref:LysR family transcriptional regulator n=1 Tax=Lutimaribacter degradans TaxID=2945989 RepID=A0ACC5ZUD1_9RHOB|nr:LysR family transcriptional regulator [Lutimaribacter sp. EGI FJ00013]MCM2561440.1 LysR family transcriptional regulator [Lutimaribacter sp. EGI FJ00013]MCO0612850.1 LysR family transcriptional regulator [Lutimaribacter sp. EGI FJ00015]MCO0635508.1 LysR family transcriptional regulator [Lutimaribacter sp. EGI FJ00014]